MRGLFYKNMLISIRQFRNLLLIFAVFLAIGIIPGNGSYWAVYAVVMLSMFAGTILRIDEATKWNQYCDILPLSRKTVVTAYYVGTYVLLIAAILFYIVASTVVQMIYRGENVTLVTVLMMIVSSFIMPAVTIPLTLKFGFQKAPIVQIVIVALVVGVGSAVLRNGKYTVYYISQISHSLVIYGLLLITLAVVVISWLISVKIYENKEISN